MKQRRGLLELMMLALLFGGGLAGADDKTPNLAPPPEAGKEAERKEPPRKLTPEERKERAERLLKETLMRQGLTEAEIEVVKQYQTTRDEAQAKLAQEFRKLGQIVRGRNSGDDQARLSIGQYREAMKAYETAVDDARRKLEEALHLTSRPKVEAALLVLGVIENDIRVRSQNMAGGGLKQGGGKRQKAPKGQ